MALTNAQLGQLAVALYTAWVQSGGTPGEFQQAVALVQRYLGASGARADWNATAAQYGLPVL